MLFNFSPKKAAAYLLVNLLVASCVLPSYSDNTTDKNYDTTYESASRSYNLYPTDYSRMAEVLVEKYGEQGALDVLHSSLRPDERPWNDPREWNELTQRVIHEVKNPSTPSARQAGENVSVPSNNITDFAEGFGNLGAKASTPTSFQSGVESLGGDYDIFRNGNGTTYNTNSGYGIGNTGSFTPIGNTTANFNLSSDSSTFGGRNYNDFRVGNNPTYNTNSGYGIGNTGVFSPTGSNLGGRSGSTIGNTTTNFNSPSSSSTFGGGNYDDFRVGNNPTYNTNSGYGIGNTGSYTPIGNSASGPFQPNYTPGSNEELLSEAQRRRDSGLYNSRTPFPPGSDNQRRLEELENSGQFGSSSVASGRAWGSTTTFDATYSQQSFSGAYGGLGGLGALFGGLGGVGGDSALSAGLNAAASAAVNGAFNGNFNIGDVVGAGVGTGVGVAVANSGISNSSIINSGLASGAGTLAGGLAKGVIDGGNIDIGQIATNAGAAAAGGAAGAAFLGLANDAGMPPALANAIASGVGVGTSEFVRGGENVLQAAGEAGFASGVSTAVGGGIPGSIAGTAASGAIFGRGSGSGQTTVTTPGGGSVTTGHGDAT